MSVITTQPIIYKQWQVDQANDGKPQNLTIEVAREEDVEAIVEVAKTAYFDKKYRAITCRNPELVHLFVEATKADVLRRIKAPDVYTVLVCKVTEGTTKKVVGTVYYQFKNGFFKDDQGNFAAEMGLFAVHPDYAGQKKNYRIGEKLIEVFHELAKKDNKQASYLYAIGAYDADKGYSNTLLDYYHDKGFKFLDHRKSPPREWTSTPDKCHELVVMLCDYSKSMEKVTYVNPSKNITQVLTIPKNILSKRVTVVKPAQAEGEKTGFAWLLDRIGAALSDVWAALCCGHRATAKTA